MGACATTGHSSKAKLFFRDLGLGVGLYGLGWFAMWMLVGMADGATMIPKAVGFLGALPVALGCFYLACAAYRPFGDPMGGGDPTSLPLAHRLALVLVVFALLAPYLWYLASRLL